MSFEHEDYHNRQAILAWYSDRTKAKPKKRPYWLAEIWRVIGVLLMKSMDRQLTRQENDEPHITTDGER